MASGNTIRDWSYREARRRFHRAAAAQLAQHTAAVQLDRAGNRVVTCSCGWMGNGLGWLSHIDAVLASAMSG